MTGLAFDVVVLAAAVHAGWNALIKGSDNKLLTTILVCAGSGLVAAVMLPFLRQPAAASVPFILCSMVLQVCYYALIARAYRIGDMSYVYPIMRGAAPLLVAVATGLYSAERLTWVGYAGIGAICAGILLTALDGRPGKANAFGAALLNACFIATYTLVDGAGVRRSGAPLSYTLWLFLLTSVPLAAWAVVARRAAFLPYARRHAWVGIIGGLASVGAYAPALWAMTLTPVPVVAALRETSILFAVAISGLILKERVGPARILGAACVVAGGAILRLA